MRLVLLALALVGCASEPCPSNPCPEEALVVTLDHAWAAGSHAFAVDVDGTAYDCTITLPTSNVDLQYCGGDGRARITFDGDGNPSSLTIDDMDTTAVTVSITLDGAAVADGLSVSFAWDKTYPNGPGCPPACYSSAASLTF